MEKIDINKVLPEKVAKKFEPVGNAVRFITKAPNRRTVDLRKIDMKAAEGLVKDGYLKAKEAGKKTTV